MSRAPRSPPPAAPLADAAQFLAAIDTGTAAHLAEPLSGKGGKAAGTRLPLGATL